MLLGDGKAIKSIITCIWQKYIQCIWRKSAKLEGEKLELRGGEPYVGNTYVHI